MKILCDVGNNKSGHKVYIGGDNWCWNISLGFKTENGFAKPIGQKFYKGFVHLLGELKKFEVDPLKIYPLIVKTLEDNTGTKFRNSLKNGESLDDFGRSIDTVFKCCYNNPNHNNNSKKEKSNIYYRVLKAPFNSSEDDE